MGAPDDHELLTDRGGAYVRLVARVREGDENAKAELYLFLRDKIKYLISRRLGPQESEDKLHDIFIVVLKAIYQGKLLSPESLLSYTRSVMKRHIASAIRDSVRSRSREANAELLRIPGGRSPEEYVASREVIEKMKLHLLELNPKHREILTRYYVLGEPEQTICDQMGLTPKQFRQAKWRAKGRFAMRLKGGCRDSQCADTITTHAVQTPDWRAETISGVGGQRSSCGTRVLERLN